MKLTAHVPATVANLGPGFDCLGLALDLCNEVVIDTEAQPGVSWEGEGVSELPVGGSDLVSVAMRTVAEKEAAAGRVGLLPPFHLRGVNRIPLTRGLGSSSAAAVAGAALARALLRLPLDPHTIFAEAAEIEGHPDNAAPAVYGGLTVVADGYVHRVEPHPDLHPCLLIPEHVRLPTPEARRALPAQVPRRDAVFNIGHTALAVLALTQSPELLLVAMRDRLHEDVRLRMTPEVRSVIDRLRRAEIPTCVSGAGPSLLAFESNGRSVPDPGQGWRLLRVSPRAAGVQVVHVDDVPEL